MLNHGEEELNLGCLVWFAVALEFFCTDWQCFLRLLLLLALDFFRDRSYFIMEIEAVFETLQWSAPASVATV